MQILRKSSFYVKVIVLLFIFSVNGVAQYRHHQVDEKVNYNNGKNLSLLVSQIGYSADGLQEAYIVSDQEKLPSAYNTLRIRDKSGAVFKEVDLIYAGKWWNVNFWKANLDLQEGEYRVQTGGNPPLTSHSFPVKKDKSFYFDPYYNDMAIRQMQSRWRDDKLAGFIDCGSNIRETNSHATMLKGMMDLVNYTGNFLNNDQVLAIDSIFDHFLHFFTDQQNDNGSIRGGGGILFPYHIIQWPNHLKGTYGLIQLAEYYKKNDHTNYLKANTAAIKGLQYARENLTHDSTYTNHFTVALLCEVAFHELNNDPVSLQFARKYAKILHQRQVHDKNGFYGHFKLTSNDDEYARLNIHTPNPWKNNGAYWGLTLRGLLKLIQAYPDHELKNEWHETLENYVYGFIVKMCEASPMKLVANGLYGKNNTPKWFSDIYHGMNMTYGLIAADLIAYSEYFDDPYLVELAEHQLLWIGGLNTGKGLPGPTESFSSIEHHGYQWLSDGDVKDFEFTNLEGTIVNGLSATRQFVRTMPKGIEYPQHLCDESWISHTGGWLSGITHLLKFRSR